MKNIVNSLRQTPLIYVLIVVFILFQSCSSQKKAAKLQENLEEVEVVYFQDRDPNYVAVEEVVKPEVENKKVAEQVIAEKEIAEKVSPINKEIEREKKEFSEMEITTNPENTKLLTKNVSEVASTTSTEVVMPKKEVKAVPPVVKKEVEETQEVTAQTSAKQNKEAFLLVAGSFKSKKNAEKLVKLLKEEGFKDAHLQPAEVPFHRVIVQGFNDATEARSFIKSFKKNNPEYESSWLLY